MVALVLVLRGSLATYTVVSGSMSPTLRVGDRLWVDKVSPRLRGVHRGDVVVFRDPGGWGAAARLAAGGSADAPDGGEAPLVKRVVGVAGDRVVCCESGRLLVDGVALDESYLPTGRPASSLGFDRTVPEGRLFVLGDDREGSLDSRALTGTPDGGFVPVDDVVGVVLRP